MPSSYVNFEIRIHTLNIDSYSLEVHSPAGDASGILKLPTDDPVYAQLVQRMADHDEDMLVQFGQTLFRLLFQGSVRDVYTRTQSILKPGEGLRLILEFDRSDSAVAALPWELLYDPDQGPLVLLDAAIVRSVPQPMVLSSLTTPLPLRLLLTAAQTLSPRSIIQELHAVQAVLSDLGDLVAVTVEEHLTRSILQRRLRDQYDIWHFIGNSGLGHDNRVGLLYFEDSAGETVLVSALELGILFQRSNLHLVVIEGSGDNKDVSDAIRSLAPALIRSQIPAVVAAQFTIPEESTRAFYGEFYRALAGGFPIDACVAEGRRAVIGATGMRNPDWGLPVLYTHVSDAKLFELPASSVIQSSVMPDSSQELLTAYKNRLFQLELKQAKLGINTEPMVRLEIADLQQKIAVIERKLSKKRM